MKDDIWEECRGCIVLRPNKPKNKCSDHSFPILGNEECPCRSCLLKMRCMTGCKKYINFSKECKL